MILWNSRWFTITKKSQNKMIITLCTNFCRWRLLMKNEEQCLGKDTSQPAKHLNYPKYLFFQLLKTVSTFHCTFFETMKTVVEDEMDTWWRFLFFSTSDAYLYHELNFTTSKWHKKQRFGKNRADKKWHITTKIGSTTLEAFPCLIEGN